MYTCINIGPRVGIGGSSRGHGALGDEHAADKDVGRGEGSVCIEEVVSCSLEADPSILSSEIFLPPGNLYRVLQT